MSRNLLLPPFAAELDTPHLLLPARVPQLPAINKQTKSNTFIVTGRWLVPFLFFFSSFLASIPSRSTTEKEPALHDNAAAAGLLRRVWVLALGH